MGKLEKFIIFTLLSGFSLSLVAQQEREIPSFDFEYTIDSASWRTSKNLSRLYTITIERVGRAYVEYSHIKGNTLNYNQARRQKDFVFLSEAYHRMSPKLMLYGKASFTTSNEDKVAGSAFNAPENKSFDLTFMDESNLGGRELERYHLLGGLGYKLSERWALGGKFDYTAINMARTKDLRHNNTVLQLDASVGTSFQIVDNLTLGVHYGYNRYIETISFNTYGTTDKQFMTLINFGAFSGKQEIFDNYGYTGKGANHPFVEHRHLYGVQLAWQLNKYLRLFNEFETNHNVGYYGKKATSSILYTEHDGSGFTNHTTLSYKGKRHFQQFTIGIQRTQSRNYENQWRSETSTSGNTVINYYAQNKVGSKEFDTFTATYLIAFGNHNQLPLWQLKVGATIRSREINSITYPYYRTQRLQMYQQQAVVSHQLLSKRGQLWIDFGMAYRTGNGDSYLDDVYVTPSTETGAPRSQQTLLMREYEYLTSNRIVPVLGAQFNFRVKQLNCFAQCNYQFERILDTEISEKSHHETAIRLGINF